MKGKQMAVSVGDRLPEAALMRFGEKGPEQVDLGALVRGKRVVIFGLPGAFTPTCSSAHLPSFIRTAPALRDKGVDEIICVSVNDPHVMRAWGEATGAAKAGIELLADAETLFTAAMGMEFSAPPAGLIRRSRRYSMLVEDGVVRLMFVEPDRGCTVSGGEQMLEAL